MLASTLNQERKKKHRTKRRMSSNPLLLCRHFLAQCFLRDFAYTCILANEDSSSGKQSNSNGNVNDINKRGNSQYRT